MNDLLVIGAGIAGIACALTAQRKGLSTLVLEKDRRERWLERPDLGAAEPSGAGDDTQVDREQGRRLEVWFGFQIHRVNRIDGSNIVVWAGEVPVVARCAVLATGADSADEWVGLLGRPAAKLTDVGRTRIPGLFTCGSLTRPGVDPASAWRDGQAVAERLMAEIFCQA